MSPLLLVWGRALSPVQVERSSTAKGGSRLAGEGTRATLTFYFQSSKLGRVNGTWLPKLISACNQRIARKTSSLGAWQAFSQFGNG